MKHTNALCGQTQISFLLRQMVRPRTAAGQYMVNGYG